MIEFNRKMEMEITIVDPRYTEQEIAEGLTDGTFVMGDSDSENEDFGKIFNHVYDVIATVDDLHVSDHEDAPDTDFSVI